MTETVRLGTRADEPEIIRLLHLMHAENGLQGLDEDRARLLFNRAFNRDGGIIGLIGPSDDIKAMIYLAIGRMWYTTDEHLEECFNYVRPDCRKSDYAKQLIQYAKTCADGLQIPLLIGVLANKRTSAKVRLYQRYLGVPAGAFFVYGAHWFNQDSADADFWKSPFGREKKRNGHDASVVQLKDAS